MTARTQALVSEGKTSWRYHGQSRPALAEVEAVRRVLFLAAAARSPVHIVHCSVAESVEAVAQARAEGQRVTCETCPQYLLLDSSRCREEAVALHPPAPAAGGWEAERLWDWVAKGTVDFIATDHCDYTRSQKTEVDDFTRTPGGLPGMETLLPLMYTYGVAAGRLTLPPTGGAAFGQPGPGLGAMAAQGGTAPRLGRRRRPLRPAPEGTHPRR